MHKIVRSYLHKLREDKSRRRKAVCVLLVLSLLVATGVVWRLKLVGITMTNEAFCGIREHTHSDDCLAPAELPEPVTEILLSCTLDEHSHTEDCYTVEEVLLCEEEHEHTPDCYTEESTQTCAQTAHTHTDDCYTTHTIEHTQEAATAEPVYICDKEVHTHTLTCFSNPDADTETEADWKKTLPRLSGVRADDILAVAASQLGYAESVNNYRPDDNDSSIKKGYTRYGEWYGNPYGDWSAMFASFCLYYADIPSDVFPTASGAYAWTVELTKRGLYRSADTYTPVPGDLAFFDTKGDGRADRVGIVSKTDDDAFKTIEGDAQDSVKRMEYRLDDGSVLGYGVVPPLPVDAPDATPTTVSPEDMPTESGSDIPTESGSDIPTESGSDIPTESGSDTPTEGGTDMPTEGSSDTPTESSSDIPTEGSSDMPTDTDGNMEPPTEAAVRGPLMLEINNVRSGGTGDSIDLADSITDAKLFIDDVEIPNWSSGQNPISVHEDQVCFFMFSFYIGNAVSTNGLYKYTYQLPSNIMEVIDVIPETNLPLFGHIGADAGGHGGQDVYMGTYSVDTNGLVTFLLDETFATSYVDIVIDDFEIGFTWKERANINPITLTIDDTYVFLINLIQESNLLTEKTVSRVSNNPMQCNYTVTVQAYGDTTVVSVVDELSGTYTYTDADGNPQTIPVLAFHEGDTVRFQVLDIDGNPKVLTGRTDLAPNDNTTAVYTITAADVLANALYNLPEFDLLSGERLVLQYPAHIREDAAIRADIFRDTIVGQNSATATINGEEELYPAISAFSYAGSNSQILTKSAVVSDNDGTITWTVNVNNRAIYNVDGLVVSDHLDEFQTYNTTAPLIFKTYARNGTLLRTENLDITDYLNQAGDSWAYTISDTAPHRYTFTYTTIIDPDYTGAEPLTNGANGRFMDVWYYQPDGLIPGGYYHEVGKRDYEYTKQGISPDIDDQTIDWSFTFQVNPGSVSPQNYLMLDTLPTFRNRNLNNRLDVVQLVDDNGDLVNLRNGNTYDIDGIIDLKVYRLNNGILNYDANGNITNTPLVIPGFNDGVTPMRVGAGSQAASTLINGNVAAFRITKTGFAPAQPETPQTLADAGYALPGTFGDYADGYAIVVKYRTTAEIIDAPDAAVLRNQIKHYFGQHQQRQNVYVEANVVLPVREDDTGVSVDKRGTWNGNNDTLHYTVILNELMTADISGTSMTWVDTYDPNLVPTGYIVMRFAADWTTFPSIVQSTTQVQIGSPIVSIDGNYAIPIDGFVETAPDSGIFQYRFRRATHCGSAPSSAREWVTVTITFNNNDHTMTFHFDKIPTDSHTNLQQRWKIEYDMAINDPDANLYGTHQLENTFQVFGDDLLHAVGNGVTATAIMRKQVDKTCAPEGLNLHFTVKLDYNEALSRFTEITFTDVMNEHLNLTFSSVGVQYKLIDGTTADIQSLGATVHKHYTSGTGLLAVTVTAGTSDESFADIFGNLDVRSILLTYDCTIIGALVGEEVEISNTITVDGLTYGEDEFHEIIQVPFITAHGSATPLLFNVLKVDGDVFVGSPDTPLAGAVFSLYDMSDPDNPALITTRTTDVNGIALFDSVDIVHEGNGYSINTLQHYRVIETTAPNGYVRTTAPKDFFIYANSDLTNGELVLTAAQQAQLAGVTGFYISTDHPINFTCTNVRTAGFDIMKTNSVTGLSTFSDDAEFTLYTDLSFTDPVETAVTTDGIATFSQLSDGTYYLKETSAPSGYLGNNGVLTVVINEPDFFGNVSIVVTGTDALGNPVNVTFDSGGTLSYPNVPAYELPETGGIGTTIFYIVGGLLTVGALILLITKKRMNGSR